jgi:hypothetical protein
MVKGRDICSGSIYPLCSVNFIPEPLYLIFNLVSDSTLLQYFFLTLGNMHVGIGLNSSAT